MCVTEAIIRKALKCIDREQWKPVRNGDKIRVKGERFMAEVTGAVYDAEAMASYLAAVSPENIAALLVEMDALREQIKDMRAQSSMSEDLPRDLIRLAYRIQMAKKEPAC